ncbi:MAG: hypothetical protein KDA81_21245 [Planctomycetaceae bacterium]|nr:hypothetical protein [Planctomycetaceae bacterium]
MLHNNRSWCVAEVASAEELAEKLTKSTWCCCQAFRIVGHPKYLWLNDSTSEDGAQEFAVLCQNIDTGEQLQIESVTFGWCDHDRALQYIQDTLNGQDDHNDWAIHVTPVLQSPQEHGRCRHCA